MSGEVSGFQSVTVFVLTNNETALLRKTVEKIKNCAGFQDVSRIIIVAKDESCDGFHEAKRIINEDASGKVSLYLQKASTVELCIAELPEMVDDSHFIIMAADMEMNPDEIPMFIKLAKENPEMIVCAAKWMKGSVVEGYGKIHEMGSRVMNSFVSLLFCKKTKDPFSIYQIYPLSVYKKLKFDNPSVFAYEYTVKALHNGIDYKEIPTTYKKRSEGKSHVDSKKMIKTAMAFCLTSIRTRFSEKVVK